MNTNNEKTRRMRRNKTTWAFIKWWINDNQNIHITIGLIGNASFFIGSVFFLWESTKKAGIWLFIIGAFFMMIGDLGDAISKRERRRQEKNDYDNK